MPVVNIQIMEGRTPEKIKFVIEEVTKTLSNVLEIPQESVVAIITEVPKSKYGIGGVPASEIPKFNGSISK
ncbi:2-hydroxymuconate tautomerase family protein [Paenibacillus brasilensis]|uniref:Tautomerase n=1 Tax=Paenibacillus brasilensis TaxID=128574 RepID=A0ABU0L5D3_9BACL|nr:2-hydroxymuconate tautomerase family protein [Paenibacillus brasilensis]MDQ0496514.1 4-oxalocrotonate tautomerase [Paenibacillus brasilensis]